MPQGDRFRSIQIGVDPIAAIAAMEIRLSWTDTQMQTSRTGLRCVPRRDCDDFHSRLDRLVADHLLKFGKTPFVNAFRLAGLTNPVEVCLDTHVIKIQTARRKLTLYHHWAVYGARPGELILGAHNTLTYIAMDIFTIVPIFIGLVFIIVVGTILFQVGKRLAEWANNNSMPVQSEHV